MSSNSTGTAGQPLFDNAYQGDWAGDLNEVSNYAASRVFEGGWTPTLGGGGGAALGTGGVAGGTYSKLGGSQGLFNGNLGFGSGCSLGTNTPAILGLPFNLYAFSAIGTGWYKKSTGAPIPLLLYPTNFGSTPGFLLYAITATGTVNLATAVTAAQGDTIAFSATGVAG